MTDLKSLIISAQIGNLDAFGKIVLKFQDMAMGYAYSILGDFHLAEDAAQEAFIEAYQNLRALRKPDAFLAWFKKIIFKHCDRFRRRQRVEILPLETAVNTPSDEKNPLEIIEERELKENVLAMIRRLPDNQRIVTTLFYINGYSQNEIADFLEISVAAVKKRLQYSRKRLKERMMYMVRENLRQNRPSRDEKFANRVQLFSAVEAGHIEQVKATLDKDAALVNARNENDQTPLHRAAYRGHKAIAELLIEKGADVNARDKNGQTPLHQLAYISTMTDIAGLLIDAGADINAKDNDGNTPLFLSLSQQHQKLRGNWAYTDFHGLLIDKGSELDVFAAALCNAGRLEKLFQENPDLANARRGPDGWTPLHYAADVGNFDIVKIILKYGADVNAQDAKGRTPLQLAAHRHATEIGYYLSVLWSYTIELLLDHGAGEDIFDNASMGRWDRLLKLIRKDRTCLCARDAGGNTPYHIAAWNGKTDALELLLEHEIKVAFTKNNEGKTAIDMAAEDGHKSAAELLLRLGAHFDAPCDIFSAATLGLVREVRKQLEENPSLANATDAEGKTVLRRASARWRKEKFFWREWRYEQKGEALLAVIDLLIKSGAEMDIWTAASLGRRKEVAALLKTDMALVDAFEDDFAPIHCAALMGHAEVIDLLLDNSASIEARGMWSCTPLHLAAWAGRKEAAETLLNRGADIEAKTSVGVTPLFIAVYEGQFPVVELLLGRGADVNTSQGQPLLWAIWEGHSEIAKLLIRSGADVNLPRDWGNSALHCAAGDDEVVECLLEHGAKVDDRNNDGQTPLHAAMESGNLKAAELLIKHGAEINAKDKQGKTPLKLALEKENEAVADLLRRRGATE
ncbi:MAG: sigma-70 family RNA polymerase sigma factor [Candidatus Poribacteria bacterium]